MGYDAQGPEIVEVGLASVRLTVPVTGIYEGVELGE
jgi:hypothetical protein